MLPSSSEEKATGFGNNLFDEENITWSDNHTSSSRCGMSHHQRQFYDIFKRSIMLLNSLKGKRKVINV